VVGHSSVVSSAAATPATAPSVAPIIGIRLHSASHERQRHHERDERYTSPKLASPGRMQTV
jgi:hypothetical protein